MAIEKVREYFKNIGLEERILEFEVSSATVELAAIALGCAPERIAKSLSFMVNETINYHKLIDYCYVIFGFFSKFYNI